MSKKCSVYLWMGLCLSLSLACSILSPSEPEQTTLPSDEVTQAAVSAPPQEMDEASPEEELTEVTETAGEQPALETSASESADDRPAPEEESAINWKHAAYADNFVDIYSGWPHDPGGAFGYPEAFEDCPNPTGNPRFPCEADPQTQVYQMNIDENTNPPIFISVLEEYEYGPVGIQADTRVIKNTFGHGFYGFVCHYRDTGNYNALIVSTKGHTGIFKLVDGQTNYLFPSDLNADLLASLQAAEADDAPLTLRAECNGDRLVLTAGDKVVTETRGGLAGEGLNGLIAGVEKESDEGQFSVNFDDYKVFKP